MKNIQKELSNLFLNSCYALCIAKMFSNVSDEYESAKLVIEGLKKGYISKDGFVSAPHLFANLCANKEGLYKDVRKKSYKPESYPQIVCWEHGTKTHFVIMMDDEIIYDTWPESETVRCGKPVSVREFI